MKKFTPAAAATVCLLGMALAVPLATPSAGASPRIAPAVPEVGEGPRLGSDYLTRPWQAKYEARRQAALEQRLRSGGHEPVQRLARGKYAKVTQAGRDKVFVVLAEFGNTRHPDYPDDPDTGATTFQGPRHNRIPRPDRSVDNTTIWQRNYSRSHYEHMYFSRMKGFFKDQSSGRYTIHGDVTQWVRVPYNEARYGRNDCGEVVCNNVNPLIRDALAYWVQRQLRAGKTMPEIRRYLRTFDRQDRYDFDNDGDFAERDGYIDHFQIVHAGGDEAAGDPVYGEDAIWSHKGFAQIRPYGTGPSTGAGLGGVNIGMGGEDGGVVIPHHRTGVWVGDYTMQPENGGLGVFAHEYAHDLGLPDAYDTAFGANSTGFWTLMSQGSYGNRPADVEIGNHPVGFTAWEKFALGWLDYDVTRSGRSSTEHRIRPQAGDGRAPQATIVLLPDKDVPLDLGPPCEGCGERYFYSEKGDDLNNTMTREVTGGGALTAQVRYDIEEGYDYAYLEARAAGQPTWQVVETSLSTGRGASRNGITGTSDGWVDLTATVPADVDAIRFRYSTDPSVQGTGFEIDQITLAGQLIGSAEGDAEDDEAWDLDGFRTTPGFEERSFVNAYIVENRQYVGTDRSLRSAYNSGFLNRRPDWVEKYPYQNGMLVWYWDSSYSDNDVSVHPGEGLYLPVDAHPGLTHYPTGELANGNIQSFDSTFTSERTDRTVLHRNGVRYVIRSTPAAPVFRDRLDWWYPTDEHGDHAEGMQVGWLSVDVPKTGTKIRLLKTSKAGVITVGVR
ncbi:MAG: peptidase immune inhibitor [Nocardioidaceae bacterium]|nr:peptidase immune inhibitor [Nocardioidaceae bacterium]